MTNFMRPKNILLMKKIFEDKESGKLIINEEDH